jgi:hypothetical protein
MTRKSAFGFPTFELASPSRCAFLPTIADLVAMATELDLERRKRDFDRYAHLRGRVVLSMEDYEKIRKLKR